MIISASRRTDIPAFYSDWFINRLGEGYILIPNPRNKNRLSRLTISPENVDCIVFWTKNPIPIIKKLDLIDEMGYPYYFQYTLTPYGRDIERNLPKKDILLDAFVKLSEKIGGNRMVWRYDPIFIDEGHPIKWHLEKFEKMCEKLSSKCNRCIISFMDIYNFNKDEFRSMYIGEIKEISIEFSKIGKKYNLPIYTCAEKIDLSEYGIYHSSCIDKNLIEEIIGFRIDAKKDPNQRLNCECIESVDIGVYDTCANGCRYCYARSSKKAVSKGIKNHDPSSPMLTGLPRGDEIITDRTKPSSKIRQLNFLY